MLSLIALSTIASVGCGGQQALRPLVRQPPTVPHPHYPPHSYLCDDYILNDNTAGDIALVQSMLDQVASQHYQSTTRSGKSIRAGRPSLMRRESRMDAVLDTQADKTFTAHAHWRSVERPLIIISPAPSITTHPLYYHPYHPPPLLPPTPFIITRPLYYHSRKLQLSRMFSLWKELVKATKKVHVYIIIITSLLLSNGCRLIM